MRISSRLIAAASLLALVGSATPAWAGGSGPTPTDPPPSGPATRQAAPSPGTPSPSDPESSSTPVATTSPSSPSSPSASATPSSTPAPSSATSSVAAEAAYPVSGAIGKKWETAKSYVGDPVAAMVHRSDGYYQLFERGVISYVSGSDAHEFHGNVYAKWRTMAADRAFQRVGYATRDGSDDVTFSRAEIIHNKDRGSTFIVEGGIWGKFVQRGGISAFGLPKSDMVLGRGGGVKKMSWFENGAITWGDGGIFAVKGAIYKTWTSAGSEVSRYGGPISDEVNAGGALAQKFTKSHYAITYQGGRSIDTSGAIGQEYIKRGMAGSDLGRPTASMGKPSSGRFVQSFFNGQLEYTGGRTLLHVSLRLASHTTTSAETKYTYRSGCPVAPSQLTTSEMNFYGYNGRIQRGVIITRSGAVTTRVQQSFAAAGQSAWPIKMMYNPDHFKGDDPTMLSYGNTSAFNCRKVTGSPYSTSPHSYGTAVDINDFENPYQDSNGKWWPVDNGSNGASYWRTHRSAVAGKGVLTGSDVMTKAMTSKGAFWGARWSNPDYQHFEWD